MLVPRNSAASKSRQSKEGVPTRRDQVLPAYDAGHDGGVWVHEGEALSAQFCL